MRLETVMAIGLTVVMIAGGAWLWQRSAAQSLSGQKAIATTPELVDTGLAYRPADLSDIPPWLKTLVYVALPYHLLLSMLYTIPHIGWLVSVAQIPVFVFLLYGVAFMKGMGRILCVYGVFASIVGNLYHYWPFIADTPVYPKGPITF